MTLRERWNRLRRAGGFPPRNVQRIVRIENAATVAVRDSYGVESTITGLGLVGAGLRVGDVVRGL